MIDPYTGVGHLSDEKLKQSYVTLCGMLKARQSTKHNKRTKKLKIDFNTSGNGHFNDLMKSMQFEIKKRKL